MVKTKEMAMEMNHAEETGLQPIKKTIYNIKNDYLVLMAEIEANEGELTPENEVALTINREQLEEKAVNYGYVMRQYDFEVDQIKAEIDRLSKLMSAKTKIQQNLKDRISEAMLTFGVIKIQQNNLALSFRRSEALVIDEGAFVPPEYIHTKEVETVDKKALKEAIKEGKEFTGIFIHENQNLQIK